MDAVLTAVVQTLPELGIGGGLLLVVTLLLRREATTENRHAAEITRMASIYAAELERVNAAHDAELAEVRADVKELREVVDRLNQHLDDERAKRRTIEDELATERRGGTR